MRFSSLNAVGLLVFSFLIIPGLIYFIDCFFRSVLSSMYYCFWFQSWPISFHLISLFLHTLADKSRKAYSCQFSGKFVRIFISIQVLGSSLLLNLHIFTCFLHEIVTLHPVLAGYSDIRLVILNSIVIGISYVFRGVLGSCLFRVMCVCQIHISQSGKMPKNLFYVSFPKIFRNHGCIYLFPSISRYY